MSTSSNKELEQRMQQLNELMDPSKLTVQQKQCIAQIVSCFIGHHIHRYYHVYCQHNTHIVYPTVITRESFAVIADTAEPTTLTTVSSSDNEANELATVSPRRSSKSDIAPMQWPIITRQSEQSSPHYYAELTSTNQAWAKFFFASFCAHLDIHGEQSAGYEQLIDETTYVDPAPFIATLQWDTNELRRIPLLVLHHAVFSCGVYDARTRSLLKTITSYLGARQWPQFVRDEHAFGLLLHVLLQKKKGQVSRTKKKRWAKIATAGVLGGVAIALTGGLAAPAVAAGMAAIGLSSAGTFLLTTAGTTTLYVLFGGVGAGYTGFKTAKTYSSVKDFEFVPLRQQQAESSLSASESAGHNACGLNVVITVSGWLETDDISDNSHEQKMSENDENDNDTDNNDEDEDNDEKEEEKEEEEEKETGSKEAAKCDNYNRNYWIDALSKSGDVLLRSDCYALQFEKDTLLSLGIGIKRFIAKGVSTNAVSTAATTGLKLTIFSTLIGALALPASLLKMADIIDNPWSAALVKSKEAGMVLAECLASQNHGHRPVTLVGYSLGGRVIFYALKELLRRHLQNVTANGETIQTKKKAKEKEKNVDLSTIVENVIILGAPISCDVEEWRGIRKLVSDRIINGYSANDWVLKFVYRTAAVATTVAGLMPIACDGIENVDLNQCISGHSDYYCKTPHILQQLMKNNVLF